MALYLALYRKWRPRTFDELCGQDAVRSVLSYEVANERVAHAYLFFGSRGTGKTSAALILAKAVNCENPNQGNPCNKCEICTGIDAGSILDVQEIDAASNTGVEYAREIREEVLYAPALAKYRVYIIDEAHMLSPQSFNALLKTIEEPPSHAVFILATTEPHKIPPTIHSRCQRFEFMRIPSRVIAERLQFVAQAEGIPIDPQAAELIARLSDGALRNALSILDQCAVTAENVTTRLVFDVCGIIPPEALFSLSEALAAKDCGAALYAFNEVSNRSIDHMGVAAELSAHFRDLILYKTINDPVDLLNSPPEDFERLSAIATKWNTSDLFFAMKRLQQTIDAMSRTQNKRVLMELALIEMTAPPMDSSQDALLRRIEQLERIVGGSVMSAGQSDTDSVTIAYTDDQSSLQILPNNDEPAEGEVIGISAPSSTVTHLADDLPFLPDSSPIPRSESSDMADTGASDEDASLLQTALEGAQAQDATSDIKPLSLSELWKQLVSMASAMYVPFLKEAKPELKDESLLLTVFNETHAKTLQSERATEEITRILEQLSGENFTLHIVHREKVSPEQTLRNFELLGERIDKLNDQSQ